MRIRPMSLYKVVALSMLGMGLVALALVFLSGRIYRDVSHENRATAMQDLVRHEARSRLAELTGEQRIRALELARDPGFRAAWRGQDHERLLGTLEAALAGGYAPERGLALERIRLLGADLAPVLATGESQAGHMGGCPTISSSGRRATQAGSMSWTCLHDDGVAVTVLVPLTGMQPVGYLEVVGDALPTLEHIGRAAGLALRIERPAGMALYESDGWQTLEARENELRARHLALSNRGEPIFAVRAAADVRQLNEQLRDARDFALLLAGAIVAAALLLALILLRHLLHPLRALQQAAERFSADGHGSVEAIPERGPDEVSGPIRSFNHMVARIGGLVTDLETEVAQRGEAEAAATAARELAEEHARRASQEKEFSQITLESVADAVIATDIHGGIGYMNVVAEELTGVPEHEALGGNIERVVRLREAERDGARTGLVAACLRDGSSASREVFRMTHADGHVLYVEHAVVPMRDAAGMIVGAVVVFHDVTEAHMLTERLTYQATHDALTGLINRYRFESNLSELIEDARTQKRHGVLCYLDLDQFKLVNDTCGHIAGDEFLRRLAELLTDRLGDRGTLARLGGDEFGLILHPCTIATARMIADELRDVVQRFRFAWAQRIFTIGVSIGIVEVTSSDTESPEALLSAADTACYMAKDSGRNRIQVYQADDQALLDRQAEMHWVSEINRALEQDRLCLYVQDIVATGETKARHFEILVRMVDDQGRVWLPGAFLPAAERYSLAPAIDRWVIRSAFEWIAANAVAPDEIYSINLSGRSLTGDGFLGFVLGELDAHAIRPRNVCFEITETAAISNLAFARSFMETLRRRGCRFALDDFGSGLSSFTYLKDLPVEFLKIDGSFVRDIHRDPVHYSIVRSMNDVGHAMGMTTIAEFVDSAAVLECLREIGVDGLQGFRYSRPHPLGGTELAAVVTADGAGD